MFNNARAYFEIAARPLYELFLTNPSPASCWAAAISLHHVADYHILDLNRPMDRDSFGRKVGRFRKTNGLELLSRIADSLKHGEKQEGKKGKRTISAAAASTVGDLLASPDILSEPNVCGIYVMDVNGEQISIGSVLERAFKFWSSRLSLDGAGR